MTIVLDTPEVTLHVGDAIDVMTDMAESSVDCIVTDPPYGDTSLDWDRRVEGWPAFAHRVLKPSGSIWCFGSLRFWMEQGHRAFRDAGFTYAQEIVWEKHNGSSFHADRFRRVHELAVHWYAGAWADIYKKPVTTNDATARAFRRKSRPPHTGHIGEKTYVSEDGGPRLMRSVLRVRSSHGSAIHPTQKPEGILRPLIEYSCPPGGLVLDPFAGSGSTGLAARQTGRRALLIEVDRTYATQAERRLAQLELEETA